MTAPTWPERTAEQVHAAVDEAWDLTSGWPIPRFELTCAVCRSDDVGLKDFRFFDRPGATVLYRCDVTAKCCTCSHVMWFGVPVPDDVAARHQLGRRYGWRHARTDLDSP